MESVLRADDVCLGVPTTRLALLSIKKLTAKTESSILSIYIFFLFSFGCLHSPPPPNLNLSLKFKRFHTPYLVVQINWGTFSSSQPPFSKFPLLFEHFAIRF